MVVFSICFLGLVAYLKDSTKADPDLSFYGRRSADKVGLKVLFKHVFYDFSISPCWGRARGCVWGKPTTYSSYGAGVSGDLGGGPSFSSLTGLKPSRIC